MTQTVRDRVSSALKTTSKKYTVLSQEVDVTRKTLYRWRDGDTNKFDDDKLEALAAALGLNDAWLKHGVEPVYKEQRLNQIRSVVNDQGVDYKGLDETLSDVELKARSLIRDLKSLVHDLDDLKKNRNHS